LVQSAGAVLTSSLHLAIFAIGAATPFAAVDIGDYQSNKVRRYLKRAGLEDRCGKSEDLLDIATSNIDTFKKASRQEKQAANEHLHEIAQFVRTKLKSTSQAP
jgi:polysaccharide pyruvyl transferase WcaK-like protein